MKIIKLGMIGFGNVAHGFIQALVEKKNFFRKEMGLEFRITSITDIRYGTIYDPDGLQIENLVSMHDFSGMDQSLFREWNTIQMIRNAESDVIIELSFTDLKTGEPAVVHVDQEDDYRIVKLADNFEQFIRNLRDEEDDDEDFDED